MTIFINFLNLPLLFLIYGNDLNQNLPANAILENIQLHCSTASAVSYIITKLSMHCREVDTNDFDLFIS